MHQAPGPSALGWALETSALALGSSEQHGGFILEGKQRRLEPIQDKPGLWADLQVVPWEPSRVLILAVRE